MKNLGNFQDASERLSKISNSFINCLGIIGLLIGLAEIQQLDVKPSNGHLTIDMDLVLLFEKRKLIICSANWKVNWAFSNFLGYDTTSVYIHLLIYLHDIYHHYWCIQHRNCKFFEFKIRNIIFERVELAPSTTPFLSSN